MSATTPAGSGEPGASAQVQSSASLNRTPPMACHLAATPINEPTAATEDRTDEVLG